MKVFFSDAISIEHLAFFPHLISWYSNVMVSTQWNVFTVLWHILLMMFALSNLLKRTDRVSPVKHINGFQSHNRDKNNFFFFQVLQILERKKSSLKGLN